ncbi:MAG: NifU family protein [Actinomycetota bacterium]|jgi:Fe/S biogenesis protein NfuA|nr:NifU family protein [Actinomycetota bacterium]
MSETLHDLAVETRPVITLTPEARRVVSEAMSNEQDAERLALWLEVRGVHDGAFAYDLYFQALADAGDDDAVQLDDEVPVVVPKGSVDRLRGARLEWSDEGSGGLVLVNPNVPAPEEASPTVPPEVLAAGLDGPLAVRVASVLETVVNPSIAGHGGRSDLVAMDEEGAVAYLRLSGGCQGCAMSRMTLTQGIEGALREEIPELVGVVDVTDHAVGENPFY